ncbi:MAG: VWA domain-containing protein [Deltaproteobacteria bacterium]|nr:VWA domain-containing protein [Deltaproteobacteria bacterium]
MKTMTTIIMSVAVATLFSSPALAQSQISNNYLEIVVQPNADWAIYTTGGVDGDAGLGTDNGKRLVYGSGDTAATIVWIDGQRTTLQAAALESSVVAADSISLTWRLGDLAVTQVFALAQSTSGNPDTVRITTTLQNAGTASHQVGLMVGIDTMIGANDGAPLYTNSGIIRDEILFAGGDVPTSWQAFENDDVASPGLVAQGTLAGGDATAPDRFLMGYWPNSVAQSYDYTGNGSVIGPDTAVSMWWDPKALNAGGAMDIVTYYGLGSGTSEPGNLALNVTSPAVLAVVNGVLSPNPFDINLVIENNHPFTAQDVEANLTLPPGLTLVAGPGAQVVGPMNRGTTALVTWRVEATPPQAGAGSAADPNDLSEGSAAALATLAFVNDPLTTVARLDIDAAIDSRAAANIVLHRDGADAVAGTSDDDLFDTIAELDVVSYVGATALRSMADFAIAHGYALGTGGNAIYAYDITVTASNDTEVYVIARDVEVPPLAPAGRTGLNVTVDTTDPADFPTIEMLVSVADSTSGAFVSGLGASSFHVVEDGADMLSCTVNEVAEGGHQVAADIIFVMDVTGSMSDEIEALKQNALQFAADLAGSNIDYRLGLISFSESVLAKYGMTADASEFRSWVQAQVIDSAGSVENPLDAIAEAVSLPLRESAEKIVILATDETYNVYNTTLAQAEQLLVANRMRLVAVTLAELNADYGTLVAASGGRFFDITAPFGDVLQDLGQVLINRYLVRCDTPRPVRDNTWRTVNVEVTSGTKGGEDSGRYFIDGGALRIDPTFATADLNAIFSVDVVADSVSRLHDAHIVLAFDPSYLSFIDVTAGELLGLDASGVAVLPPTLVQGVGHDPAHGIAVFDMARNHSSGTDGTGVLATVRFKLTHRAAADLDAGGQLDPTQADDIRFDVTQVLLQDENLTPIRITAFSHGDVDDRAPSLLGDFDQDGDIDLIDFNTLAGNWGSTAATVFGSTGGDIAPVTGTAPNLSPASDGLVNFQDLFVFTRMWNWYRFERQS